MKSLLILPYCFANEIMHKMRINISGKPKIMINSQDMYFDIITRSAQVELKNINIFSKKNPLGSSCRNGKEFI
jgi:hypothetical protein